MFFSGFVLQNGSSVTPKQSSSSSPPLSEKFVQPLRSAIQAIFHFHPGRCVGFVNARLQFSNDAFKVVLTCDPEQIDATSFNEIDEKDWCRLRRNDSS